MSKTKLVVLTIIIILGVSAYWWPAIWRWWTDVKIHDEVKVLAEQEVKIPWEAKRIEELTANINEQWIKTKVLLLMTVEIMENQMVCGKGSRFKPEEKISQTIEILKQLRLEDIQKWDRELQELGKDLPATEEENPVPTVEENKLGSIDLIINKLMGLNNFKGVEQHFPLKSEKLFLKTTSPLGKEFLRWLQASLVYTWDTILETPPTLEWTREEIEDFHQMSTGSSWGLAFTDGLHKDRTRKELSREGRSLILPILSVKVRKAALHNNWKKFTKLDFLVAFLLTLRQKNRKVERPDGERFDLYDPLEIELSEGLDKELKNLERGVIWVNDKVKSSVAAVKKFYTTRTGKDDFSEISLAEKVKTEAKFLEDFLPKARLMKDNSIFYNQILNRITFADIDTQIWEGTRLEYPVKWKQFEEGEAREVMIMNEEHYARPYEYGFNIHNYSCNELQWTTPAGSDIFFLYEKKEVFSEEPKLRTEPEGRGLDELYKLNLEGNPPITKAEKNKIIYHLTTAMEKEGFIIKKVDLDKGEMMVGRKGTDKEASVPLPKALRNHKMIII